MSDILQPVVSDIADLFTWKATAVIASNDPTASANKFSQQLQVLGDSFFCLVAYRGCTNYDPIAGEFITDDISVALYSPAVVPNHFEVMVQRENRFKLMDRNCPQGVLCSTGYRSGNVVPWPILYAPNTTFNIDLYNITPVVLTQPDQSTPIPLRIDFGMFGYNVPVSNLRIFIDSWPALYGKAIDALTSIKF